MAVLPHGQEKSKEKACQKEACPKARCKSACGADRTRSHSKQLTSLLRAEQRVFLFPYPHWKWMATKRCFYHVRNLFGFLVFETLFRPFRTHALPKYIAANYYPISCVSHPIAMRCQRHYRS